MTPLFSGNTLPDSEYNWKEHELKLTGRDESLWELMDNHANFMMHREGHEGGDHIFVFINWGCETCDNQFHIETLKEEFPEWSHEFFEMWEGHNYFMIS